MILGQSKMGVYSLKKRVYLTISFTYKGYCQKNQIK